VSRSRSSRIDPELIAQVINVELHELRDVVISLLRELRG
jgi:hypothetical protein